MIDVLLIFWGFFRVISRVVAPVFNPTLLIRSFLFFSELFVYSGYQPSVRYIAGKKKKNPKMKNKTHSSIPWSAFSSSGLISYTKAFQCYKVSIGQSLALILELRKSNSGTHSLNLYLVGYCLYLLLEKSQHFRFDIETYVSFCVGCFLCMVICVCVFSFIYMLTFSFPSIICWRCCLFSSLLCWHFCQIWASYNYVNLCLGLLFCSLVYVFVFVLFFITVGL